MGNAASITLATRQQGNALYQQGNLGGAVQCYRKALANSGDADSHLLYSNMSACLLAAGLLHAALESADACIAAQPTWPKGHYRRAAVLAALELWPEATLSLRRALEFDPQSATVQELLKECVAKRPPPALRGGGMAYTWGKGEFGALGHGDVKDKMTPRVLDELRGVRVADIACGTGHSLVVSEGGDVYAWGWNSKGQCGLPPQAANTEAVCSPTMIGSLLGMSVRGVACGAAHSLAVTANGEVLSWGLGGSGQLGHGDYSSTPNPRRIMALSSEAVLGVASGFGHSIALSRSGALYSWGWNRDGQLGVGDLDNRTSPQRLALGETPMQHVACGGGHSAVVSTSGELFCFGSGSCGQLGLGEGEQENALQPTLVSTLVRDGVHVALAACGEEFTIAIADNQSVYAFGLGNVGQMGGGVEGNSEVPVLVAGMEGRTAEAASCGAAQAHVVSTSGQVYVWGLAGTDTQTMVEDLRRSAMSAAEVLAHGGDRGKDLSMTMPQEVGALKGKRVTRLDAGRRHFAALISPASPRHSRLTLPCDWEDDPPARLPAGKRAKLKLQIYDAAGRAATSGGERVVARLLWDGGDEFLLGGLGEAGVSEEAAAAAAAAISSAAAGTHGGNDAAAAAAFAPSNAEKAAATEQADGAIAAALLVDVDDGLDGSYEVTLRPLRPSTPLSHLHLRPSALLSHLHLPPSTPLSHLPSRVRLP